jgi:hypothetical protein
MEREEKLLSRSFLLRDTFWVPTSSCPLHTNSRLPPAPSTPTPAPTHPGVSHGMSWRQTERRGGWGGDWGESENVRRRRWIIPRSRGTRSGGSSGREAADARHTHRARATRNDGTGQCKHQRQKLNHAADGTKADNWRERLCVLDGVGGFRV